MLEASLLKDDPPVREDGLCALSSCRKPRKPERSKRYGGAEAARDPFCSTECARIWHGCPLPVRYGERELLDDLTPTRATTSAELELDR